MTAEGPSPGVPTPAPTRDTGFAVLPGARHALILLVLINLFNYIDRQVLAAVLSDLEIEFVPNDPNGKAKLGALTTAFMVAYMLIAPLFGWLGDRMNRWVLVSIGVILWSLATGASGLATGYVMLLMTRCLVGVGEAAYGPVAPGIISDLYPVERRGSVLAWFYVAIPVGSALGYVLGGAIASTAWGWRGAFLVVVIPGILLGLWSLRMPEPPRGLVDQAKGTRSHSWRDYLVLGQTPSYVLNTLGMTAMTFVLGGVGAWMPSYVYQREGRFALDEAALRRFEETVKPTPPAEVLAHLKPFADGKERSFQEFTGHLAKAFQEDEKGQYVAKVMKAAETKGSLGLDQINLVFGGIVVVSGLFGTLLGGLAGDRFRTLFSGSYFIVSGVGMLVAFPFFVGVLWAPLPLGWVLMFLSVFCLFFNTGPTNTILANVTPPAIRSSAFALNILIIHALGDAISPFVIGLIADQSSLGRAFFFVSYLIPISGLFWLWGALYLKRDTERAPTRLSTPAASPP